MTELHPSRMADPGFEGRRRVVIDALLPSVDGGRFPVKRIVGDTLDVEAHVFADGHDEIAVRLRHRSPGSSAWDETDMHGPDNDRWFAKLPLESIGRYEYSVAAWVDHFASWRRDLRVRRDEGVVEAVDLAIGRELVDAAAGRAEADDRSRFEAFSLILAGPDATAAVATGLGDELGELMARYPDRRFESRLVPARAVVVDPVHARFGAWYELFPRSTSPEPGRHGTFRDVIDRLPYVADLGFDVLYLPPIHPIGRTFRKGPNNTLTAGPDDPGVPWAIGAAEGGHADVHPGLGSIEDFDALVSAAARHDIRVALDIAFQASADHPYLESHRDWFRSRPDGTIQYAENPPKKYQDIYPFDFETDDWRGLWQELLSVVRSWMDHGVRIFRVDNPHTKSFDFWEWLIGEVKATDPDVLFLAEAFTRPKVMYRLAKLGFSQSYTYFTWRNEKDELRAYLEEITRPPVSEFFRPNFFVNTPDILHAYLQEGGRPAFQVRLVLAATLTATYGIYGPPFELLQARPLRKGSEEYLDSEKYQLRHWDLDAEHSIAPLVAQVNAIRRAHPALQSDQGLAFHDSDDDAVLVYSKRDAASGDVILCAVNLDVTAPRRARIRVPLDELGLDPAGVMARELLSDRPQKIGPKGFEVTLDPATRDAAALPVRIYAPGPSGSERPT